MFDHRIAVTGLTQAGKTVFLTSLIDHWLKCDPNRFRLDGATQKQIYCKWSDTEIGRQGRRFFLKNRARLERGDWPEKTLSNERYELLVKLDGRWRWKRVTFIDIPGERFADADMLLARSFDQWSDEIRHRLGLEERIANESREFLALYDAATADEKLGPATVDNLAVAYQRLLAQLILRQHPFISPSSILVDQTGQYVPDRVLDASDPAVLVDWLSTTAECGLHGKPVFPLPPSVRATESGRRIAQNYLAYCQQVVRPALAPLAGCQDVFILIDIVAILENGPEWKNVLAELLDSMLRHVAPGGKLTRLMKTTLRLGSLGWMPTHLRRISFIATQIDRVHPNEHDRLGRLLESLYREAARCYEADGSFQCNRVLVAAVNSTHCADGLLSYNRQNSRGELEGAQQSANSLPDAFEEDWCPDDYQFPRPAAIMPKNRGVPPAQINLERVTRMLFKIK